MKILFWNIGRGLDDLKLKILEDLIHLQNPSIVGIAEGPLNEEGTTLLEETFIKLKFRTYFSPTRSDYIGLNDRIKFDRFGLKIFYRNNTSLDTKSASFLEIDNNGRTVFMRMSHQGKAYSLYFVHLLSKVNNQEKLVINWDQLKRMVLAKRKSHSEDTIIILGDFNAFPWDDFFTSGIFFNCQFLKKSYDYESGLNKNRKNDPPVFYNSLFHELMDHSDENLFATYYGKKHFGILDYALVSRPSENISNEVITEIGTRSLLKKASNKLTLHHGFDHLPILLNID